ncbi:MAG: TlpA disulfide reductase family protein [Bacteroidota bacterium]
MKKFFLLALFILTSLGVSRAQNEAEIIKFDRLDALINERKNQVTVINFWATWCGPCIKELPHFEAARKAYGDKLSVNLISLDFADQLPKVHKFMERKGIESNVYLLDEIDYNSWIDRVDKSWSGAIPATLIVDGRTDKRKFVENELTEAELNRLIEEFIQNP